MSASTAVESTTTAPVDYVAYVSQALDFMQRYSYRADEVDWQPIRDKALAEVEANPTAAVAYNTIGEVIQTGRRDGYFDTHTGFERPWQVAQGPSQPIHGEAPSGRRLPGDVGYLNLPTVMDVSDQRDTYASSIRTAMETIDAAGPVCGWVIDLRHHQGGDSLVGLTGLGPLLGAGVFLRFVGPGTHLQAVGYQNGQLLVNGQPITGGGTAPAAAYSLPGGYIPHDPAAPVAVLTSEATASAGEAILVAFLGRPDTRTFGEPTRGLPTARISLTMPDGAVLSVTDARDEDRLGRSYTGSIQPDQTVLASPDAAGDPVLDAATTWLTQTQACTTG